MLASYRLQLTPGFTFEHAQRIIPFLRNLGISHLYLSPILQARPESTHGYDVTDPDRLREEFGGEPAFRLFSDAARDAGLRVLLDIVPNHMAADSANPWWWDVLKHGRASCFASFFDVLWEEAEGRIVLPVLGRPLEEVLGAGEITFDTGSPHDPQERVLAHHGRAFPIAPQSIDEPGPSPSVKVLLDRQAYRLMFWREGLRAINYRRFFDISDLVAVRVEDDDVFDARHELVLKLIGSGAISDLRIDHIDGLRDPASYLRRLRQRLDERARDRVDDSPRILVEKILIGDEKLPEEWPVAGTTGYEFANETTRLFIDPASFRMLESDAAERGACRDWDPSKHAMTRFHFALAQAKRLACEDLFPAELHRLANLLSQVGEARGGPPPAPEILQRAIQCVTETLDVYRTYIDQRGVPAEDRQRIEKALASATIDLSSHAGHAEGAIALLRFALLEGIGAEDSAIRAASMAFTTAWQQLTGAVMAKGGEDTALYRHIALTSLNEVGGEPVMPDDPVAAFHAANAHRAEHWPQSLNTTATHDTKRGEDTRARISVLSEIPDQWVAALDRWMAWHECLRKRIGATAAPSPADEVLIYQSLLGILPPSPMPERSSRGNPLDQSLVDRLQGYMVKAAREAKTHTNWYEPDEAYEQALSDFIAELLEGEAGARFREDIAPLAGAVSFHGAINSLSQLVLKIASPGVPDFYRGTELWDLTLVDPDNRRSVDYDARAAMVRSLPGADESALPTEALAGLRSSWPDGRIKLFVTQRGLAARRAYAEVFSCGQYIPLKGRGRQAAHVCAFARCAGESWAIAVVPRLTIAVAGSAGNWPLGTTAWSETLLPLPPEAPRLWVDALSGLTIAAEKGAGAMHLGEIFAHLPVALLTSREGT